MVQTIKRSIKELTADVPDDYVFKSCNGHILHNMKELGEELKTMSSEDYAFHVNAEKNDFANWVGDIIKDKTLANNLRKTSNLAQAAKLVANRIRTISSKSALINS